jgi:signal transduction histidine kinase
MPDTTTEPLERRFQNKAQILYSFAVALVLAMGSALTWLAYQQAQERAFNTHYATVSDLLRNNTTAVDAAVGRIAEALNGLAEASYAQPDMSPATFSSLSNALMARHPAIQSISLAQSSNRAEPDLAITEKNWLGDTVPAATRSSYLPIRMMQSAAQSTPTAQPSADNALQTTTLKAAWLGFDLLSIEPIAQAVAQASRTGRALSYTGLRPDLTLFVMQVRSQNQNAGRYVVSEIDIARLLSLNATSSGADVQILDTSEPAGQRLLHSSLATTSNDGIDRFANLGLQRRLEQTADLKVLDKAWSVNLRPQPSLFENQASPERNVAILGGVATLLSAFLLYNLISRNTRIQQEVDSKTRELDRAFQKIRDQDMVSMQTEKMSSLGQMIAGIAHEINTPLGFVTSNVQTMQDEFDRYLTRLEDNAGVLGELRQWSQLDQAQKQAWYERALAQAQLLETSLQRGLRPKNLELTDETIEGLGRINELVAALKDFSRVDRSAEDDVDLHHCISRTLTIARNETKHKAEVITHFGELPLVRCNPSQINQVLLNLINNAAQAIENFGKITITTALEGEFARIVVEDNGSGMSEEVMRRAFEPFYSTKQAGKGTGLGLAISEKIVKDHGGSLEIASQLGVGSAFTLRLPIQGKPSQTRSEPSL